MAGVVEYTLVGSALLLLLSVLASKLSDRFGIPALLLFLAVGMLAGSEGLGGIYFDDPPVAQFVAIVALALILFSGGLSTHWEAVRPVAGYGFGLSTLGVLLTAITVGLLAHALLSLSLVQAMLLGAIISSTDAAAVFSILRAKGIGLKGYLRPLLELESGSNDPMAVLLTVGLIQLSTQPETSLASLLLLFVRQMLVGAVAGYVMGKAVAWLVNRVKLGYDGTLGLLVFPSRLIAVAGTGLLVAACLMLVARPLSVFIGLLPSRMNWREKAFVSWIGLRGAVPIVLATCPLLAGIPLADLFFNVVFFVVLTSVLLQGTSIPFVARLLHVDAPLDSRPAYPLEYARVHGLKGELDEIVLPPGSAAVGKQIVDLRLPPELLVVLVARGQEFIIPSGATQLQAGDRLLVLAEKEVLQQVGSRISAVV